MSYRVLENKNVPRGLEQVYAQQAVAAAQARAKAEQEQREAETQRRKRIDEELAAIKVETARRKEQEAERQRKLAAERFENSLHEQFLTRNPGATEGDWSRNRRAIIDEAMKERAFGRDDPVMDLVAKKRASGFYGNL